MTWIRRQDSRFRAASLYGGDGGDGCRGDGDDGSMTQPLLPCVYRGGR